MDDDDLDELDELDAEESVCGPRGLTNAEAFENYHTFLKRDLATAQPRPATAPFVDAALDDIFWYTSQWLGRYMRRRDTIEGSYGNPLRDVPAKERLVARLLALDAAVPARSDWDGFTRSMIDLTLQNCQRGGRLDVGSVDQPHRYGPSMRRLWAEAKASGRSDAECWADIAAWGNLRPTCWAGEDARRKDGLAERLAQKAAWQIADDLVFPWATRLDGQHWQVRLNDFPDEPMYALHVEGTALGDFHDWPANWHRA